MLMLNHFLRLLVRAVEDFPTLLGGNFVSLLLPFVIFIFAEGNELRRGGWSAMSARIGSNTKYLIGVYALLFVWAVIHTTYRDHMDLAVALQRGHTSLQLEAGQLSSCTSDLRSMSARVTDKQDLVDTLQKTIISMQGPQAQQQANIASCITNLSKMNPIIHERIQVVPVFIGTIDVTGSIPLRKNVPAGFSVIPQRYMYELLILTNVPEPQFRGILQCAGDYYIMDAPSVLAGASMVMISQSPPKRITDRSYDISYDATGTEWNQSHPAYMRIRTNEQSAAVCSFTKTE